VGVANEELLASWERTRGHLARAWVELPPGELSVFYQEFLDHNELGLAMEVLAEAGVERNAKRHFWLALADAATEMHRWEDVQTYENLAGSAR
jgi:hypothetical protein